MASALKLEHELAAIAVMTSDQLHERWAMLGGEVAPQMPPSILRHLLAQRLQERKHGALPVVVVQELARIATGESAAPPMRPRVELTPGTRLIREWNGQTLCVDVLEEGFSYDNETWRSLSEIARHVTGAHWSGPRFFGLTSSG